MPSSHQNINDTFFEGLYKDVWKKIIPKGLTEAECDLIQETGALEKGATILDIMCGYGRHSIELGKRGFDITAVDNLKDYIQEIETKAKVENLPIKSIASDVLKVELSCIYDLAICMGNSFAFFDKADATRLLKKVSSHLKKGGVFIINSWMIAEIAIKYFREHDWHYSENYKCILENRYLFHPSRIETEQTIIAPDGQMETINGIDYIFTLNELENMFQDAGLATTHLFSTPRKRKFALGDSRIYIVAEKL